VIVHTARQRLEEYMLGTPLVMEDVSLPVLEQYPVLQRLLQLPVPLIPGSNSEIVHAIFFMANHGDGKHSKKILRQGSHLCLSTIVSDDPPRAKLLCMYEPLPEDEHEGITQLFGFLPSFLGAIAESMEGSPPQFKERIRLLRNWNYDSLWGIDILPAPDTIS
jgi:hypothetical protein